MSDLQMTTASGPAKERANIASVQGQLLVLVLDMNPNQMFFARHPQCLIDWLNAALALANSHLMLNPANSIAAVAAHSESCSFLYPNEDTQNEAGSIRQRDGQFEGTIG